MRLGTGIVGVFQRGPALLAQEAAALADASDGRFVLGIGSSSDRIVEGWNGIPFEKPLSKVRETLDFLRTGARRRAHRDRLQARSGARPSGCRSCSRRCAARCSTSRSSAPTAPSPTSCRSAGCPRSTAQLEGAPEGFELLCRFFCIPGEREAGRAAGPLHVLLLHHRPGLRRLLPLARLRRADRRRWSRPGRPATARPPRRRRPGRLIEDMFIFGTPGADEGAARRLRRGRHHAADPHPDRRRPTSSARRSRRWRPN